MKAVLVAPRLPPQCDGVGDHAHALAQALSACGHDVTVLTAGPAVTHEQYRILALDHSWGLRATMRAWRFLRNAAPDRVFIEYTPFLFGSHSPAPLAIAWICRVLHIRCTVIAHEIFYGSGSAAISSPVKERYFAWRDTFVLSCAGCIAVPSTERRDRIYGRIPDLKGEIQVVPIAANVEPHSAYKRKRRSTGEPFYIVAFGVVMPRRRFELAIRALAALREDVDAHLTIMGRVFEAPYAETCMSLAAELGLGEHVIFTDSLAADEITEHLGLADAAIHTTMEGTTRSSGSLLALLAHEIPIVAARTVFDDACFDDILIRVGDEPDDIARALRTLAMKPQEASDLGSRAAATYRKLFDWRAVARALAS